jgi:hypothetical protein
MPGIKLSTTVTETKTIREYVRNEFSAGSLSSMTHPGAGSHAGEQYVSDESRVASRKIDTISLYGKAYVNRSLDVADSVELKNQNKIVSATDYHFYVLSNGDLINKTPMDVTPELSIGALNDADTLYGLGSDNTGRHNLNDQNVKADLIYLLKISADAAGVTVHGTSGYRGASSNPSGRHNGNAYDVQLRDNGKTLSVSNPADYEIIKSYTKLFVINARTLGYRASSGIANPAYPRQLYMGGNTFHYDITGGFPYWGGSGSTKNVPAAPWHIETMKLRDEEDPTVLIKNELSLCVIGKTNPEQMKTLRTFLTELTSNIPTIKQIKAGDPDPINLNVEKLNGEIL